MAFLLVFYMYKLGILTLIFLYASISIATSGFEDCIFPKQPLNANILASGKLVRSLWSGKLYFKTQRDWNLNSSQLVVAPVCDSSIKWEAGKSFLYFTSHLGDSRQLTFDSNIIPINSSESKEVILKFASSNNFIGEINPSWQYCESDNECVQVENQCGKSIGVNKNFKVNYLEFLKSKKFKRECSNASSSQNEKSENPKCIDNFCNEPDVKIRTVFGFTL
jgi:hypothetical protein